ncbi:MAG: hypothetical protein IPJ88_17290 [Myxococcales bacterium]|nr:MAG: hypothetical protein IPJ88_17290 [Myxococcales bacterium]
MHARGALKWHLLLFGVCFALALTNNSLAQSLSVDENDDGQTRVSWLDSAAEPRSVRIRNDQITTTEQSYLVDGITISDQALLEGGRMVHHGSCTQGYTSSDAGTELVASVVFSAKHHALVRRSFRLASCSMPSLVWRITNDYFFQDGSDGYIQTVAYDSSDIADDVELGDDMRGPYSQFDWPKNGIITGMAWGTQYKFETTSALTGSGDPSTENGVQVNWDWSTPNTIPYVMSWASPSEGGAVDREVGVVQNQSYQEQDMGGGYYDGGDSWASAPPLSGSSLPAVWALPTQMSGYDSSYSSGRITWGGVYGAFNNGHSNDTGTLSMGSNFRPVNAWSWTHVVGKHSDAPVKKILRTIESTYQTKLTALAGNVWTEGPRGPGNFVSERLGAMPTTEYLVPGYDFVYRAWRVDALDDVATLRFELPANTQLSSATIIVSNYTAQTAPDLYYDASLLQDSADYYASLVPSENALYLTLRQAIEAGVHVVDIGGEGLAPSDIDEGSSSGTASTGSASGGCSLRAHDRTSTSFSMLCFAFVCLIRIRSKSAVRR